MALADQLRRGEKMPGWKWGSWFVAIMDQHGRKIGEVPIADTLEDDDWLAVAHLLPLD